MDRMIYLSMSGAKAMLDRQAVLANNLANVSTTGFRAELSAFRSVPVEGSGASTRVFALETTIGHDASARSDGRHRPRPRRRDAGQCLAGAAGARRHRGLYPRRRADGARGRHAGQPQRAGGARRGRSDPRPAECGGQHRRRRQRQRDRLRRAAGGGRQAQAGHTRGVRCSGATTDCSAVPDGAALPADAQARLQGGALEGSNVSPVGGMVAMIAASRQYETQMKLLQTAESRREGGRPAAVARLTRARDDTIQPGVPQ